MKPSSFDYVVPQSIGEALSALGDTTRDVRLLAGGQSLVPMMNFRLSKPDLLIDLNRIPEIAGIDLRPDGSVRIGAMTRHRMVETSSVVRDRLPLLHGAMPFIAHVQIRNRGTMGGSLSHADPAAEWPALCVALDASMVATSPTGSRTIAAKDFAVGVLTTAMAPNEILTEVSFPAIPANRRWGFQEISRRRGDFALAGVACTVDFEPDGAVMGSRVAIFGVADVPLLSVEASQAIAGKRIGETNAREAGRAAAASISPRSDLHASSDYRTQLIEVLVSRALTQAAASAARKELA